jgi:HPt (histidine-containing phosphotransfer) domain-containing protein
MSESSNFQVINPPNTLKAKVPQYGGPDLEKIKATAASGLEALRNEFDQWVAADLTAIEEALTGLPEDPQEASSALRAAQIHAKEIKGQAANFDYPLLGQTAQMLFNCLESNAVADGKRKDVIIAHVGAMRVMLAQNMTGMEAAAPIIAALEELTAKTRV